jgi:hypothetical protein
MFNGKSLPEKSARLAIMSRIEETLRAPEELSRLTEPWRQHLQKALEFLEARSKNRRVSLPESLLEIFQRDDFDPTNEDGTKVEIYEPPPVSRTMQATDSIASLQSRGLSSDGATICTSNDLEQSFTVQSVIPAGNWSTHEGSTSVSQDAAQSFTMHSPMDGQPTRLKK